MSGLKSIMANGGRASKARSTGNLHVPHVSSARLQPAKLTMKANRSARRARMQRVGLARREIRFRFVLMTIVNGREELWTGRALPVDGHPVRLRGFRKSHHLIRAGPGQPQRGLQLAATRQASACRPAAFVSTIVTEICKGRDGMSLLEGIIDSPNN